MKSLRILYDKAIRDKKSVLPINYSFEKIQDDLQGEILTYIPENNAIKLAVLCKNKNLYFNFFNKRNILHKIELRQKLLKFVIDGNLNDAETILQSYSGLAPFLSSSGGWVEDHSGRYFKNPTPLKLALWSWKYDMQVMLLKYMPPAEALCQLRELEEFGIEYDIRIDEAVRTITEPYYDFNIIDALQQFYNYHYGRNGNNDRLFENGVRRDYKTVDINDKKEWCQTVGQAQLYAPSSIVELYYGLFRFHRVTNQWMGEEFLTRSLQQADFDNYFEIQSSHRFNGIEKTLFIKDGLGDNFAIIRGECSGLASVAKPDDLCRSSIGYEGCGNAVELDLEAVKLFRVFCVQKLEEIKNRLEVEVSNSQEYGALLHGECYLSNKSTS